MIFRDGLSVRPLDAQEARWLHRLEKVLLDQPRRLLLVECGDSLLLVDRDAAHKVDLEDGKAGKAGIVLAEVRHSTFKVTGVSG